jgi:hypothetical protein
MSPYNVEKFILPLYVDFFADVAGKKWLPRQQTHFFAKVTMYFCWCGDDFFHVTSAKKST